jgi:hypothetical protein
MSKIDLTKIAIRLSQKNSIESSIERYKIFYAVHLFKIKNRQEILPLLYSLSQKFYENSPNQVSFIDMELLQLKAEAIQLIEKYFGNEVLAIFNKKINNTGIAKSYYENIGNSFWQSFLTSFVESIVELRKEATEEWTYQRNFIIFLNNCFANFGLHENISKRNPESDKRFNLIIEHYNRSRKPLHIVKTLLSFAEFDKKFLLLYKNMQPLNFEGQLIPFNKISKVKITTTLLKDDEVLLFAQKHNFQWTNQVKDFKQFTNLCLDETERYHPNPFYKETFISEIDAALISQIFDLLKEYPSSLKSFKQALHKYERRVYERNILDDLRLSLEDLLKQILKNNKSLENQLPEIGKFQKEKGTSSEIINMLQKLINYYSQYQNNYVKHSDKVKADEIEFVINLTSTFMKFIAKKATLSINN